MNNTRTDAEKFNFIYAEYKERFIRFARTYVYDADMAEDIVIESLLNYWEERARFTPTSNIPSYILTVIKHKCLNYLNSKKLHQEIENRLHEEEQWELNLRITTLKACDPEKLFSQEIQSIIDATINELPEQTREIFIKSRYYSQSHKEIAEQMNLSAKSVEYHISKSLRLLRVRLKDYFPLLFFITRFFS